MSERHESEAVTAAPVGRRRRVAGVILAAGTSSRLGRNKLLLDIDGEPLVRRGARAAIEGGLDPVMVVLGHEADRVRRALDGLPCTTVFNPDYVSGAGTSVACGLESLSPDSAAAVILLGDMPFVGPDMVRALVERYHAAGAALVVSEYDGVPAPPVLYDRSLFAEFRSHPRGRDIVRANRRGAEVLRWPAERMRDVDGQADYERITAQFAEGR